MIDLEDFSEIINWENFFKHSDTFKNNTPFKFVNIEEFFKRPFYEKLYETYPKFDETWSQSTEFNKSQFVRGFGKNNYGEYAAPGEDPKLSPEWNKLYRYFHTDEFVENFAKFSGVPVNKMKTFRFTLYRKGGFQLPHIHNEGPSTLIVFFYFSKGWEKGDPGGTYVASEEDESKIIFETQNLDNTMSMLQDGPLSAHGARYITKDVERRALQIYFEVYSEKEGWSRSGFKEQKANIQI